MGGVGRGVANSPDIGRGGAWKWLYRGWGKRVLDHPQSTHEHFLQVRVGWDGGLGGGEAEAVGGT